jgi:FKBP-type peptidyl-prolyl cis-trans isomerase FklB
MRMKTVALSVISAHFLVSLALAGDEITLKDQKTKDSYSLGYQFGRNVAGLEADLDKDVLVAAVRAALEGKKPLISLNEMRETVDDLRRRVLVMDAQRTKERAAKNLEEAKAFLEANGKKEGVVTLPSGLQYKVAREGQGAGPKMTDGVRMRFRGTLTNGAQFDNTMDLADSDVPVIPVIGVNQGLAEALQLMKPGAKWQIFVPPDLGYGESQLGRIPSNSVLIYEIEQMSVVDRSGADKAAAGEK